MKVELRDTPDMGRGVFAIAPIARGEIIFSNPVVIIPDALSDQTTAKTVLNYYGFSWSTQDGGSVAFAFGLGSLLNHSADKANVTYRPMLKERMMRFRALRRIAPGEQLLIDYGYNPVPSSIEQDDVS